MDVPDSAAEEAVEIFQHHQGRSSTLKLCRTAKNHRIFPHEKALPANYINPDDSSIFLPAFWKQTRYTQVGIMDW